MGAPTREKAAAMAAISRVRWERPEEWANGRDDLCAHCGRQFWCDIDPCLGYLEGVVNACCGHGDREAAYIQWKDGITVRGFDVVEEGTGTDDEITCRNAPLCRTPTGED